MIESDKKILYITKSWVVTIFIYYSCLFILGLTLSLYVLICQDAQLLDVFSRALVGSISISVTASSIAYIRKLYKLCFSYDSSHESVDQLFLKRLGTIVYFITRPLFAVGFALLIVIGIRASLLLSSSNINIDEGFIYLTMSFSFYIGFLSGTFIKKLEQHGEHQLNKLMK